MSARIQQSNNNVHSDERIAFGIDLLSQQIWCWGKDILRPEGNLLVEQGFELIKAPAERKRTKNIYSMYLPEGQRVILRGFGVVYCDERYGSIFVPRYEFIPKYASHSELKTLPWGSDDLLEFMPPTDDEKKGCSVMMSDLIDWIIAFERQLPSDVGAEYRPDTLVSWDNGKRRVIPAQDTISEWEKLRNEIGDLIQIDS